jgi:hypothetical protein
VGTKNSAKTPQPLTSLRRFSFQADLRRHTLYEFPPYAACPLAQHGFPPARE